MNTIRLLHIAPELPPTVGGVADYTAILSQRIEEASDGTIEPVLIHAGNESADAIEVDHPVVDLSGECSALALQQTIERLASEASGPAVVLLEYSGYGYAKRGTPLWLARGLRRVCGTNGIPLITIFHEISATGPIWTSAFWLSPFQMWVVRELSQYSSGIITTHSTRAGRLKQIGGHNTPVNVCPVFSNVGEPDNPPSFADRAPRAVIFGGSRMKKAIYETRGESTRSLLERWAINTVVDVGSPPSKVPGPMQHNVEVRGLQPANAISQLLLDARIGLFHYPASVATKSGILAAYMAHGITPILVASDPPNGVLKAEKHFATIGTTGENAGPRIARAAVSWYDRHAHSKHAARKALSLIERTTSKK